MGTFTIQQIQNQPGLYRILYQAEQDKQASCFAVMIYFGENLSLSQIFTLLRNNQFCDKYMLK